MRRTMVVGVLVGAAVLAGSPALAAPPEINQKACEDAGGTFGRERGVKSCTTTSSVEVAGPPVTEAEPVPGPQFSHYIGVSRRIDTVQTTTVESQKGNGDVSFTSSDAVLDTRIEPLSCTYKNVQIVGGGGVRRRRFHDHRLRPAAAVRLRVPRAVPDPVIWPAGYDRTAERRRLSR